MKTRLGFAVIAGAGIAAIAIPLAAQQGSGSAPTARYDMRAGTVSGFAGMGAGGMMGMMLGGGRSSNVQHELHLRLGSGQAPAKGAGKADHFMPPSAKLGKSVQLVAPARVEREPEMLPQKPKGRLLIFWGCGETSPKGQPVVIDFARVAAGQMPAGMPASAVVRDWGPTATNSRTFTRWPAEDGKFVKSDSSLPGAHRVASNYAPEISFTLTKDFMRALNVRTSSLPSGASLASWTGIPDATAYLAGVFGGKQGANGEMGDMVMWTSSASRQFGGGLSDWLTPAQAATLVRDRTLLAPTVSNCTVPADVIRATPDFRIGTLTAFGPQEDFAYPPRPANASATWRPDWTARIRHRSTTSWMQAQGMTMGGQGAGAQGAQQGEGEKCKRRGGLGGMLGGALGGGSGC
ncbi:MAG: hypothetical protein M0R03_08460 [Novosphingobium sp.]|nr:hypothetical protein [Novosphingobium sp.]